MKAHSLYPFFWVTTELLVSVAGILTPGVSIVHTAQLPASPKVPTTFEIATEEIAFWEGPLCREAHHGK